MQNRVPAIVTLGEQPDLSPIISAWLSDRRSCPARPESCFVLLAGGVPAGTASLVPTGLATYPELTPWLANLFVPPAFRGRGHGTRLVAAVEAAARAGDAPILWLVTRSARQFYARLGWQPVAPTSFHGDPATLMRRDFGTGRDAEAPGAKGSHGTRGPAPPMRAAESQV